MRPDYIDRFDLKNFKRLRSSSLEFHEASVGFVPSVTVVSHAVMGLGVLPKDLPWKDNLYRDAKGIIGPAGLLYDSHKLNVEQFLKLGEVLRQRGLGERSLGGKIKKKYGGRVFVMGEKLYGTMSFATPVVDSVVTLEKQSGVCRPTGVNIPAWVLETERFELECKSNYGTEDAFYPYDGAKLTPGEDINHLGGDVWLGDLGIEVMQREAWSALFLTFGGIDKAGHLWGTMDSAAPHPFQSPFTLESALRTADLQLGRLLDELERQNLRGRTLIVVTADHGSQTNRYYLGNQSGDLSGTFANLTLEKPAPFWIERISKFGPIQATVHDTAIRIWLTPGVATPGVVTAGSALPVSAPPGPAKAESKIPRGEFPRGELPQRFRDALAEVSGVQAIFQLRHEHSWSYRLIYEKALSEKEKSSWTSTHQEQILDALASEGAPDLVLLLEDGVGFDLLGDHGGAQESVQKVPLFLSGPSRRSGVSEREVHLSEISAFAAEVMNLETQARETTTQP